VTLQPGVIATGKQLFNFVILSHNYFYCIFDKINAALMSIKYLFQKHHITYKPQNMCVMLSYWQQGELSVVYL